MKQTIFTKKLTSATLAASLVLTLTGFVSMPLLAGAQQNNLPPLQDNSYNTYGNNYDSYNQQGQSGYNNAPPQNYGQNYGNQGYNQGYTNNAAPLQGRISSAPAGTPMMASFATPVSSEFARVGDRFNATLGTAISGSDGQILLPSGTQLEAQIVMVQPAGRTGKPGQLDVRFTSATLPSGQRVPLSARLQTEDGTGIIKGGTTKGRVGKTALNTAVGAGLGAALGTAMGPLSGGKVGRGAIYGTAIGGGAGLAKGLWNKGEDAVVNAGQPLNIVLDQPLTVTGGAGAMAAPAAQGYPNYGNSYTPTNNNYTPYGNTQQPQQQQYNNYNNYGSY